MLMIMVIFKGRPPYPPLDRKGRELYSFFYLKGEVGKGKDPP